jgi:4-hydroxy-2-oxovalerate aldolase
MPTLLDCTLRDGSYEVNFSFAASDTSAICKELEDAGIRLIEVGHGVGLGASERTAHKAVQTDEEYMRAASSAVTVARWGMFCIPGIAVLDDVDKAADYGMGFIRVGTDINKVESSQPFIARAKKHGMFVAANYMKSYAASPAEFVELVSMSEAYGVDCVYIVDSSGGMLFGDIERMFVAIRERTQIPVGFHGHNNLGLANSNSMMAAQLGVEYLDSSLQGLGRSSGNAVTESLVLALMKSGVEVKVDHMRLIQAGQKYVRPLIRKCGHRAADLIAGFADFHSSYMPHIHRVSSKYQINPLVLMIEMSKVDKVDVTLDKLEGVAAHLERNRDLYIGSYELNAYVGGEQDY